MLIMFLFILFWALYSALYICFCPILNNGFYAIYVLCGLLTDIVGLLIVFLILVFFFKHSKMTNKFKHFIMYEATDLIMLFSRVKLEVKGRENIPDSTFVVFGNHKSLIDPVLIYHSYKKIMSAAGKKELEKVPFLRDIMAGMGVITINRNNDREAAKSIVEGIKNIKDGYNYIIFPEGGIKSRETEEMVDLKPGAYKLATKSMALISPVSIIGTSKLKERKKFGITKVKLVIHKPISYEEYKDLNTIEIGELVEKIINDGVRNEQF